MAFNNVRQHKLIALVVTGFLANSDTTVGFQLVLPLFDDLIDVTKVAPCLLIAKPFPATGRLFGAHIMISFQ